MARTDQLLKKDVTAQLAWDDRIDDSAIQVRVSDGTVELRGTVPDLYTRSLAVADAWAVPGIADVRSALEISRREYLAQPDPHQIRAAVSSALSNSALLEGCELRVGVQDGVVTLEGTVDKFWKRASAEQIASSMRGVHDIESKIAVVPSGHFTDQQVAEDVLAALDRTALFNTEDVVIKVTAGVVTMRGTVPSWTALQAALDAARYTLGVREVENELRIIRG